LPTSTHLHPTPIPFDPQTYLVLVPRVDPAVADQDALEPGGESRRFEDRLRDVGDYIAQAILETTRLPTRLKGILIGNGWIDPWNQYPAYYEYDSPAR
jgi:hypothetical protein